MDKSTVAIQENGQLLTSNSTIANAFSSHFSSITSVICHPRPGNSPFTFEPAQSTFKFSPIEEEDVLGIILHTLNASKATGADGISARLLKLTAPSNSLILLFNHSLQTGSFPEEWKHANVTPVSKSGDKHLVQNYRPISVIPVVAKAFETLVHKQLYNYLNTNVY